MDNKKIKTILTGLMVTLAASAQYKSQVWSPDNGDGTYTNPVINADYSDPDVCVGASGEDYYMTASLYTWAAYSALQRLGKLGDCRLCAEEPLRGRQPVISTLQQKAATR